MVPEWLFPGHCARAIRDRHAILSPGRVGARELRSGWGLREGLTPIADALHRDQSIVGDDDEATGRLVRVSLLPAGLRVAIPDTAFAAYCIYACRVSHPAGDADREQWRVVGRRTS